MILRLAVVTAALVGAACVQPIVRPMRIAPGPRVTAAVGGAVGGRDEVFCYEGCKPQDVSGVVMAIDGGYGWLLRPWAGVSVGARVGGGKRKSAGGANVAWAMASAQHRVVAGAAGFEVGSNSVAGLIGVELRPLGDRPSSPRFTAYAHAAAPLVPAAAGAEPHDLARASWDVGASLRLDGWLVQYAYDRRVTGRFEVPGLEGAGEAASWHAVVVGRDLTFSLGE